MAQRISFCKAAAQGLLLLALVVTACGSIAQKPAHEGRTTVIVVPYSAGGAADMLARHIAHGLAKASGDAVLVENRPGANGSVRTHWVARAPADGRTLLLHTGGIARTADVRGPGTFEAHTGVTPVVQVGTQPLVLAVSAHSPYSSIDALIAAMRSRRVQGAYGSAGVGANGHILGDKLRRETAADVTHVPYTGEAAMLPDLVTGRLSYAFVTVSTGAINERQGGLRLLAVTSAQRHPGLPQVPSLVEKGLSGFDLSVWFGLFVPAGTPASVIERIEADVRDLQSDPDFAARLAGMAIESAHTSRAQFERALHDEQERWIQITSR